MGLDIRSYRRIQYAEGNEGYTEGGYVKYPEWSSAYVARDFPSQGADIRSGVPFKAAEESHFRAGSYSGYNAWRNLLARLVGFTGAPQVWEDGRSRPFTELIHFSDCDGCIGPTVSAKLAADFAQYQDVADAHEAEWFRTQYANWRKAFEMAADNGVVVFR